MGLAGKAAAGAAVGALIGGAFLGRVGAILGASVFAYAAAGGDVQELKETAGQILERAERFAGRDRGVMPDRRDLADTVEERKGGRWVVVSQAEQRFKQ